MKISWCRFNQIHRPEFSQQNDLTTAICKVPGSLAWVYKFETSLGWTECVSAVEFKPHTHISTRIYKHNIKYIQNIQYIYNPHTHKHFDSLWYMYIYIYINAVFLPHPFLEWFGYTVCASIFPGIVQSLIATSPGWRRRGGLPTLERPKHLFDRSGMIWEAKPCTSVHTLLATLCCMC